MSVPATADPSSLPSAEGADAASTGRTGATNAQERRADVPPGSSAETSEQSTRGPDYFRQAFAQLRGRQTQSAAPPADPGPAPASVPSSSAPPASSRPAPESAASVAAPSGERPQAGSTTLPSRPPALEVPRHRQDQDVQAQPAQTQQALTLTPQELDRRIQSEVDRREARRAQEQRSQAEREREVELRRTNPFEYARMMEEREQQLAASQAETQRLTGIVASQLEFYDRGVLDPFVGALPEALRAKVISKEEGIPGRRATAQATVKALRDHWRAEGRATARETLMKDPTFIKEILARYGPQATAPAAPPPPAVRATPSSAASGASDTEQIHRQMNDWMRASSQSMRSSVSR